MQRLRSSNWSKTITLTLVCLTILSSTLAPASASPLVLGARVTDLGNVASFTSFSSPHTMHQSGCTWADLNCDHSVDVLDVVAIASRWNCSVGDTCFAPELDFDGDLTIGDPDVARITAKVAGDSPHRALIPLNADDITIAPAPSEQITGTTAVSEDTQG